LCYRGAFTAKILQNLTRAKIASANRGPNGRIYLSEKSKKLPARSILKAMHEDGVLINCVLGLKNVQKINAVRCTPNISLSRKDW